MTSIRTIESPIDAALHHLLTQQHDDGCWEGEMVWCTMILSQHVIVQEVLGRTWNDTTRRQMIHHFAATRTADGAWGLHPEAHGYVFTTTLAYIALRLLGLAPDDPLTAPARRWLHQQPHGVLGIPAWGKFWLALVDLYEYEGVNPTLPELFLLPRWLPFHPSRYYCHTRYIYLAMAYLFGTRFRGSLGAITADLRRELYDRDYATLDFAKHRNTVAASDLYVRPSWPLQFAFHLLRFFDRFHPRKLRKRALDYCFDRILYEQRASRYQGLSPVNGLLNCLVLASRNHPELPASVAGQEAWKWTDDELGLRYAGARSQTWDTAFALLAILDGPPAVIASARGALLQGYQFLKNAQATTELDDHVREGRDAILGGWCFSDGVHRWPVGDCTAEALTAVLKLHASREAAVPRELRITDDRLEHAARFILARQNSDGGFGTYERRRGPMWLEMLNPSEMYGACMVEGSYIECTASSIAALAHFREAFPAVRTRQVNRAIDRGSRFLRRRQLPDGAWPAAWGVHHIYGVFHAVRGLRAVGVARSDSALQRAAQWLIAKQQADGGWGEHFQGCLENRYVQRDSQPVMTAWALIALMEILGSNAEPIRRGIRWLDEHQQENGGWQQWAVNGVFFGTAMLDYRLYKVYFPTWALNRFNLSSGLLAALALPEIAHAALQPSPGAFA